MDSTAITTALTSGFTEMVTNVVAVIAAIVPIGLGMYGISFAISKSKKFFAKVAD